MHLCSLPCARDLAAPLQRNSCPQGMASQMPANLRQEMPFCGVESRPALERGVWVAAAPPHLRLVVLERNVRALVTCAPCPVQDTTGCLVLSTAEYFTASGDAAFLRPQMPCTGQRCLCCSSSFNLHLLVPGRNVDALFSCAFCPMTPQAAYSCLLQCSPCPRHMTFAAGTAILLSCHCLPCTGQRCLGHGGSSTPACLPVLGRNTWAPSCSSTAGLESSRPGVHCCMCISPSLPLEHPQREAMGWCLQVRPSRPQVWPCHVWGTLRYTPGACWHWG